MSAFKEQVKRDIHNTFLDVSAFAETYLVEGKEVPLMVDNNELRELQNGQDLAVAESGTLFYAAIEDLPHRRAPGESLNINGRECIIDDWKEHQGVAVVVLRENIIA